MRFSWSYLFTQYGYGDNQDGGTGVHSYPLDYVYSGHYHWATGRLYFQGSGAHLWSSTIVSSTSAYSLAPWPTGVNSAESLSKARGFALRCDLQISIPDFLSGLCLKSVKEYEYNFIMKSGKITPNGVVLKRLKIITKTGKTLDFEKR